MDPIDDCRRALEAAGRVIATVDPDDLDKPTPCDGWTVRRLLSHMIGMCDDFATGLRGEPPAEQPAEDRTFEPVDEHFDRASQAVLAEWRQPGALDKTIVTPFATFPAAIGVRVFIGDELIHTWDLATALGAEFEMDEDLALAQFEMMKSFYNPENRGPDKYFDLATAVHPDASIQDQLIALSGREVR